MKKTLSLLTIFLVLAFSGQAQKLTRTEKKIIAEVASNNDEALAFLEKVVNMNSGTMNLDGVKKVGDEFDIKFKELGFTTSWREMPEEMNRAGHLFAEVKGTKGKRLLLIGHLDTVFEEESPFQKWQVQDSIAFGPGAEDMKGGNVIIVYALKALKDMGLLSDTQIIVALHGDEEESGKPISISRKDIIEAGKRSDIALGFEGSGGLNEATTSRRGSSGWRLEVSGVRAHSSGIFNEKNGAGAIFEVSRILSQFYDELHAIEYLTFNPGVILGGTFVDYDNVNFRGSAFGKSNVIPQTAIVTGGLRFISEEQKAMAREKMTDIVENHYPQTGAEITFWDSYPAMPPTEGNNEVLAVLNDISVAMGRGEVKGVDPLKRGAADISFVAQYTNGIDGLGAIGGAAHTPEEYMDLRTFEEMTQRAAILIYRLTR